MDISFIIITNGSKPDKLDEQLRSIQQQKIPNYEIVICGQNPIPWIEGGQPENIKVVNNEFDAVRGSLGGLRNRACEVVEYENLVISDDDMLFTKDWYANLLKAPDSDILTTCIRNPDGTRFWDNACYGTKPLRHFILNYNQSDDSLYMSGGQSWLMKKKVWDQVKWNPDILFYKAKSREDYEKGVLNEDLDYSLRCREAGFKVTHFKDVVVYHNDPTYTSIGRLVRRRNFQKDYRFWLGLNIPPQASLPWAKLLFSAGAEAEAADLIRKEIFCGSPEAYELLKEIETHLGGKLENSEFTFDNKE